MKKDISLLQLRKRNHIHELLLKTIYKRKNGIWRAEYIRKHGLLNQMGERCFYEPIELPSDSCLVRIHDNVRIAFGVKFITHDIISQMFSSHPEYCDKGMFKTHYGAIEIYDNVFVGGKHYPTWCENWS